jgi:rhodanese-related sulfurtransferase
VAVAKNHDDRKSHWDNGEDFVEEQLKHYQDKLAYEIDSWDLKVALEAENNIIVVDARSPQAYATEHIPSAINIPHRQMSPESTGHLDLSAGGDRHHHEFHHPKSPRLQDMTGQDEAEALPAQLPQYLK